MFNLKGVLVSCLLLTLGVGYAQQWQVGLETGSSLMPVEKDTFGSDFQPKFYGGLNATYNINPSLAVRSGVFFTHKTHTISSFDTTEVQLFGLEDQLGFGDIDLNSYTSFKSRTTQYYLEIPLMAVYRYKMFNAYLGPNFSYMLYTRAKEETITEVPAFGIVDLSTFDPTGTLTGFLQDPYTYDYREGSSKAGLNPFDVSLRAGLGIEMDRIGINLFYNHGFLQYRSGQGSENRKYRYFQATVNYNFDLKSKGR